MTFSDTKNIRAKKSLGQNFLKNKAVLSDMIKAGNVTSKDVVLEIGPGTGFLTEMLLETGASVIAVEKDARLIPLLKEKFAKEVFEKRFILIHGDITEKIPPLPKTYKLIANIPYYVTGEILRTFLEIKNKPLSIVLLVQKEVAERIISRDGKGSILSESVCVFGTPTFIRKVPKQLFRPQPKVDSAIISIQDIHTPFSSKKEERFFFSVLRFGFAHKRKKLLKNLVALGIPLRTIEEAFQTLSLKEDVRPETLTSQEWLSLTKKLSS